MSEDGKAPSAKEKQPPGPNVAELPGPVVQLVGVEPQLLQDVIDLLQSELPMRKARRMVESLEKCQIFAIPKK